MQTNLNILSGYELNINSGATVYSKGYQGVSKALQYYLGDSQYFTLYIRNGIVTEIRCSENTVVSTWDL